MSNIAYNVSAYTMLRASVAVQFSHRLSERSNMDGTTRYEECSRICRVVRCCADFIFLIIHSYRLYIYYLR